MALSSQGRGLIIDRLIATLDDQPFDEGVEASWDAEIKRRPPRRHQLRQSQNDLHGRVPSPPRSPSPRSRNLGPRLHPTYNCVNWKMNSQRRPRKSLETKVKGVTP